MYGCDALTPLLEAGLFSNVSSQENACQNWFAFTKELFRYGLIEIDTECDILDASSSFAMSDLSCGWTCTDSMTFDSEYFEGKNLFYHSIL